MVRYLRPLIRAGLFLITASAGAVGTSHWTQTSEADFKGGTFQNVVATNFGDLKLSRAVHNILEPDPRVSAVYSLAEAADGTIYAGTGPQGVLLAVNGDKVTTAAKLDDNPNIFCVLIDRGGSVLLGTGGERGRVLRLGKDRGKPAEVFSADGVQYVWAIRQTPDGNIYAATGPKGKLFEIRPDGTRQVLLETDENNLLSLLSDGKDLLYVGTDPNGLIYRVNRKTRESFILFDAGETEISALAMDKSGNLYAATAEAREEPPGQGEQPAGQPRAGRPESGTGGQPIPSQPAPEPKPPQLPNPTPGEPPPIPKGAPKGPGGSKAPLFYVAPRGAQLDEEEEPEPAQDRPRPGRPGAPDMSPPTRDPRQGAQRQPVRQRPAQPRPEGNAIYRIDRDGFVTEIFRQNLTVLSMIEKDGVLLVGTGSEGNLYQVSPAAEETVVLAKVDAKQVMCLLPAKDGRIFLGTANVGGIAAMSSGFAAEGTYTSAVLDASQISRFGKMQLEGTLPGGATLKVATRSGNVRDPGRSGWSKWTGDVPASEFTGVTSPAARFLQYRLTFSSKDGGESAVVDSVSIAYQVPNLGPVVRSVRVAGSAKSPAEPAAERTPGQLTPGRGTAVQTVAWDASDPNGDSLTYSVYLRSGARGPWVLLQEKLREATLEWDTRTVADGRYELKVVASDAAANPRGKGKNGSRVSDPILVDNTPPMIGDIKWKRQGAGNNDVKIDLAVMDRTSTIAGVDYSVDSRTDWQAVLPSDNIFDSPSETVGFVVPSLKAGPHQVTIRATDSRGNRAYETVSVTPQPEPQKNAANDAKKDAAGEKQGS